MNIPNIANLPAGQETMKFEQKKMTSASKTKVSDDFFVFTLLILSKIIVLIIIRFIFLTLK